MEQKGLAFQQKGNFYMPAKFLGEMYFRKKGPKTTFPNVGEVVEQTITEFPDFADKARDFILYACHHDNGFATTDSTVRKKVNDNNGLQHIIGAITATASNCDASDEKYKAQLDEIMDKAGLVHLDIKPDQLSLDLGNGSNVISSMKVNEDYKISIFAKPVLPTRGFTNNVYVQGPKRDIVIGDGKNVALISSREALRKASAEAIKKDALSVAAITQALNETFVPDFLRYEESFDDGEDLSDFCM
jgi:hypothetical protein